MKIKYALVFLVFFSMSSCTKSSKELFESSEQNTESNQIDLAIKDLQKLLEKYPNDSLASKAQYKLASIHLNWKNDLRSGLLELQNTVDDYGESIHGEQAQTQIDEFPDYILNKAESLRKRKLLKEAVDHLMYMTEEYSQHEFTPKAQYMLGDIYMNDFIMCICIYELFACLIFSFRFFNPILSVHSREEIMQAKLGCSERGSASHLWTQPVERKGPLATQDYGGE